MSHRIACYTLFDITKTGILNRARPGEDTIDTNEWYRNRNTQCNFDTILQVVSLRAQPDVVTDPRKFMIKLNENSKFGYIYKDKLEVPCWTFDFEVQHPAVFEDGIEELGSLYRDCQGVPMIRCDTQWHKLSTFLDSEIATRNIYFVKY